MWVIDLSRAKQKNKTEIEAAAEIETKSKTLKTLKTLYMPSTPLNVLVSCALAVQHHQTTSRESESAQLWLIDQKNSESNPYFLALQKWQDSPFEKVAIFSGSADNQTKMAHRKQLFENLTSATKSFKPNQVAVGSDRRVEFQFVMQLLKQLNLNVKGIYLDDGLYSYAGRPYHVLKDGVNALLKKFAYGLWWREPKTVGASSWINQAWLFAPNQAVELLRDRPLKELQAKWFIAQEILNLSQLVAQELKYNIANLSNLDVVLLIPHPNNIKKMPGYKNRIQQVVNRFAEQGKRIGVKYHPRTKEQDLLELMHCGATEVIPAQLAFEFCLPVFNTTCHIIGDVGTALFTCKWLRPDLQLTAVLDEHDDFQKRFIAISNAMQIHVTNQLEDIV